MGQALFSGGGGNGVYSEDCTATANDIPKGLTALFNDSDDDIGVGTLELTGTATSGYVFSGKTFYNTDIHTKITGTMTVNNIPGFSVEVYGGRQVLLKWQNPYASKDKFMPFGGVFIRYNTKEISKADDGIWLYTGYGNNTKPGEWSQIVKTMPDYNTTYYFVCTAYVGTSINDIWGTKTWPAYCTTGNTTWDEIKSSSDYYVPVGYNYVDIFCVGGGAGGGRCHTDSSGTRGGGGGGGGYTATKLNLPVIPGEKLTCVIGAGGMTNSNGGATYVIKNNVEVCRAEGGKTVPSIYYKGGNGGSGGGEGGPNFPDGNGRMGGSNGSNGYNSDGGIGQSTTTTPFGENNGTAFSGGGGGGGFGYTDKNANKWGGVGGVSGGGAGGTGQWNKATDDEYRNLTAGEKGWDGQANTGGGGGGGGGQAIVIYSSIMNGGSGGSGFIIIRAKT